MSNRRMTQFFYTAHAMPVLMDCNFTVAATNGLGITGLKGPGILNVFMHTSTTPAVGNGGITNPNPANGYALIQFRDNYYKNFYGWEGVVTQNSGTPILVASAGVTANVTYVITVVGTTTTAGWQSLGLAVGITPAVGVAFVASGTVTAVGTGAVQIPHVNGSGIVSMEGVGDASTTLNAYPLGVNGVYPYMMVRFMGPTDASTTTPIAKAPADGSIISLKFYMSNSSVLVAGE